VTCFIAFLARCLLVLIFLPFSALDKLLNYKDAVRQASEATVSARLAKTLIVAGFVIEVVMSSAILTGIADRLAAFIMAFYCLITALLWKQLAEGQSCRERRAAGCGGHNRQAAIVGSNYL
jgi:putative oxidoreductase